MERSFPRSLDSLDTIFEFVARCPATRGIEEFDLMDVQLIVEEFFTNMVKYNNGRHEIAISLDELNGALRIRLVDFDVEPFDMSQAPPVDMSVPPHMRKPSGLGIELVRKVSDSITCDYADRTSTVTVIKRLGSHHV